MAVPSFPVLAFENLGQPDVRAADIFADDVITALASRRRTLARADGASWFRSSCCACQDRRWRTARSGAGLAARRGPDAACQRAARGSLDRPPIVGGTYVLPGSRARRARCPGEAVSAHTDGANHCRLNPKAAAGRAGGRALCHSGQSAFEQ